MRDPDTDQISAALEEIYRGPAWHGPSVLESLQGVNAVAASRRVVPGRHTIRELVRHLAHGRHLLIERLQNSTFDFPLAVTEPWWPVAPAEDTDAGWNSDLALLDDYHHRLVDAVRSANRDALARIPHGSAVSVAQQMLGMAFHDAYHAGQIKLLATA